jgi:alkanesulfonate monooxygenase SsuD/methylene tetrahydromethanopterin reductase-like flavin-dependent oxidoreductase (luciferase family)
MLEESARIARQLLHGSVPLSHEGDHYQLERAPFAPRRPLPILIGGGGEKRTLRTLARWGDIMNVFGTPDEVRRKNAILDQHCQNAGRDPAEIRRTVTVRVALLDDPARVDEMGRKLGYDMNDAEQRRQAAVGDAEQIVRVLRGYDGVVDEIVFQMLPMKPALFERLDCEVLAALA